MAPKESDGIIGQVILSIVSDEDTTDMYIFMWFPQRMSCCEEQHSCPTERQGVNRSTQSTNVNLGCCIAKTVQSEEKQGHVMKSGGEWGWKDKPQVSCSIPCSSWKTMSALRC